MKKAIRLGASLACANLRNLEADIGKLVDGGIDYLHFDVMDGRFVPNLALDFVAMAAVKELTNIPLNCHLMVERPERFIDRAAVLGAACIEIHFEATYHVQRVLRQIRDTGAKAGIALNPATPIVNLDYILDDLDVITVMMVNPGFSGQPLIPAMLRKTGDVRRSLDKNGYGHIDIQVDGNASFQNIPKMVAAGATMLVGGTSSVFHKNYSIGDAIAAVRKLAGG